MQVGYNDDDIRRFLPREVRQRELIRATFKADFNEKAKDLIVEEGWTVSLFSLLLTLCMTKIVMKGGDHNGDGTH